jgi:protein phosphatase methylesterase 1
MEHDNHPANMSDFQKAFVKSRLDKLPPGPPQVPEEDPSINEGGDGDDGNSGSKRAAHHDDDSSSASSASSTTTVVPSLSKNLFARPKGCVLFLTPFLLPL